MLESIRLPRTFAGPGQLLHTTSAAGSDYPPPKRIEALVYAGAAPLVAARASTP